MASHDALPDTILELILLSLDSPLCLHRAASTCKRWRRIITSDAFAALHKRTPAAVAGSYHNRQPSFRPRFVPSPSAAAAVDGRRHFSLGFIPGSRSSNWRWRIMDSRGSLLLLRRNGFRSGRQDLIVCEPLTRRHVVIPRRTPDDGLSGDDTVILLDGDSQSQGGRSIGISMSEFKVLWLVQDRIHGRLHASMFSSASSTWRVTSIDGLPALHFIGIAAGRRRYWHDIRRNKVFVLDLSAFSFSSFVLPDVDEEDWDPVSMAFKVALTTGHDGEDRIAVVSGGGTQGTSMKIFARVQGGGGEAEWALDKTIQLSAAMLGLPRLGSLYFSCNLPVEAGKLKIRVRSSSPEPWRLSWLWFRFDMETMEAERLLECDVEYVRDFDKVYPCEFPWPWSSRACHDKT